jgi:hypothetical protein
MGSIQQITESQLSTLTRQWRNRGGSHLEGRGTAPVSSDEIRSASLEGTLQSIMAIGNRSRQTGDYRTAVKRIVGLAHEALGLPPKW